MHSFFSLGNIFSTSGRSATFFGNTTPPPTFVLKSPGLWSKIELVEIEALNNRCGLPVMETFCIMLQ